MRDEVGRGDAKRAIVVAGGGTGGHLFPALAVADELRRRDPSRPIEFVGGRRGLETRLVPAAGYPLRTLPLSGIKGAGPVARAVAVAAAAAGTARCLLWMLRRRPALVVGVGGYASGPAVLAARLLGVRTMLMEQNHFPGATNRWLARWVDTVCVPSEAARKRLGGLGIVTGNPVRAAFGRIRDLEPGDEVSLLVFGGSRGARSINRAVVEALPALARLNPPPRIVHQAGGDAADEVESAYRAADYPAFEVRSFLDDMPERVAAADLVICRAGATTLAELAAAGRPAILVPYPHAADDHQRLNAEAVERAGGAVVLLDRDLRGETLAREIGRLASDPALRRRMGDAARRLARPDAASRIADEAQRILGVSPPPGGPDVP